MGYFLISRVFDFNKKDVRGRGVRALMPFCQVRVSQIKHPNTRANVQIISGNCPGYSDVTHILSMNFYSG